MNKNWFSKKYNDSSLLDSNKYSFEDYVYSYGGSEPTISSDNSVIDIINVPYLMNLLSMKNNNQNYELKNSWIHQVDGNLGLQVLNYLQMKDNYL